MAAGQVGPSGVAAPTVSAEEISGFEREPALIHCQVVMEHIVRVKTLNKWTA